MLRRSLQILYFGLLITVALSSQAQNKGPVRIDLNWTENVALPVQFSFPGAIIAGEHQVPTYYHRFRVSDPNLKASVKPLAYSDVNLDDLGLRKAIGEQFAVESYITSENGSYFLNVAVIPFRIDGRAERLDAFSIEIAAGTATDGIGRSLKKKSEFASESKLSTGEWLKIRTDREGIYEITKTLLESGGWELGNIDLSTIKVFGSGGGLLPEPINSKRIDDLEEINVKVIDQNGNNRLDAGDHIFFYGQGAVIWIYDEGSKRFIHENHPYSDYNYYFITFGGAAGKRIGELPDGKNIPYDKTFTSYDVMQLHEEDDENFIESGREWYGNSFKNNTNQTFNHSFTNLTSGVPSSIRYRTTARSTLNSYMDLSVNGQFLNRNTFFSVTGDYTNQFADQPKTVIKEFNPTSENISLQFHYIPTSAEADAWIDYYELAVRRDLVFNGSQGQYMVYSPDIDNLVSGRYQFTGTGYEIWDVSDHMNTAIQTFYQSGGKNEFIVSSPLLNNAKRYCAFNGSSALSPVLVGRVKNQNLHGFSPVNYIMVTNKTFQAQANRLADFHRSYYNVTVAVVDIQDIYNEFSSGKADVVAIRDFIRMMYERSENQGITLENVLLFGDGSYDYKNRIQNNTNFVPTFQSRNSISPTQTYASDNFFVILEPGEGRFDADERAEGLDAGIGRIPARTEYQAKVYVDKVIRYHSRDALGSWRNNVTLLGDDEDQNTHFKDSETMAAIIEDQAPVINVNKIYLDAFEQVSFGSGDKYPAVNEAIDKSFEKGHLLFNYLGHGGGSGMAHERVVTRTMINEWDNKYALPLVITATCELSRYDDPAQDSPGELMIFNENGGAIGMITTTRLVIIGNNSNLNEKVLDSNMFLKDGNGQYQKLGQVFTRGTNNSGQRINQRNFTLLGDPGTRLSYPEYNVVTTKVNDSLISGDIDTVKAFTKMRFEGEIRDFQDNLVQDFNGTVDPTVFDKVIRYQTLANDPKSYKATFSLQNSAIYRGKVSVTNGKFFFEFVVPKDIDYRYGQGKIVYYAQTSEKDAAGMNDDIVVGGSSDNQISDSVPPTVELFMDDEEFIFGGLTGESSTLLVKVSDANGINTVGNGIGRDITAKLDEDTDNEELYILNDFYQAKLNSYQEGEIAYRLNDLAEGRHTVTVKVWDVFNNSNEAYTEFVVAEDAEIALDHVLNYPNPFTTFTTFHFDHNKSGRQLDVTVKVMTQSGRVIKTLFSSDIATGGHFQGIDWDGKDDFGDTIGRGVYVYKVIVKSDDGTSTSEYQKLVILK